MGRYDVAVTKRRSPDQQQIDQHMAIIRQTILDHGWMVQGVFSTPDDPEPSFAYTIGLTEAGLPELLIAGNIKHAVMAQLLNSAGSLHVKNEIKPGDVLDEIASMPLRVRAVKDTLPLQQAHNYYRDPQRVRGVVSALQLVWPDKAGAYPDQVFYDRSMAQPLY